MRQLLLASSLSLAIGTLVPGTAAADPIPPPHTPVPPAAAAMPPSAPVAAPSANSQAPVPPPAAPPTATTETPKKAQAPSAEAPPKADAKKSPAEIRKLSDTYFKQCMQDWDAATHMTRTEWERTCRRVVDSRAKFMLDQMGK
jgi:hypothetical protein